MRPDWWALRGCADVPTQVFFPVDSAGEYDESGEEAAKAVCAICPVRAACLDYALDEGLREGIYGGVGEYSRRPLRRARKAAQARKARLANGPPKGPTGARRPTGPGKGRPPTAGGAGLTG